MKIVHLSDAHELPAWRRPFGLLVLMAVAMPLAFSVWMALLNNFVVEVASFDGVDIGRLHMIREIPGLLAVSVIIILLLLHEQILALISLIILGLATAVTAQFPELTGILILTFVSSIGFHYFETVNQSLQLQWVKKDEAPQKLAWLMSIGSAATFVVYAVIMLLWEPLGLNFNVVYITGGTLTALIAAVALIAYPRFETPHPQSKKLILRRKYWLYYALQFLSGARRQIFVVFAGFMMVEKFGFAVHEITALYLINLVVNIISAPLLGAAVKAYGERAALLFEYAGLVFVFLAYGGVYFMGWGLLVASGLYILDHIFFALKLALKTYFQKIADPADIAPTAAVAFTINHIAAVGLPLPLGLLWVVSPGAVFILAAGIASCSFALALLIPRHPTPGYETRLCPKVSDVST